MLGRGKLERQLTRSSMSNTDVQLLVAQARSEADNPGFKVCKNEALGAFELGGGGGGYSQGFAAGWGRSISRRLVWTSHLAPGMMC